VLYTSSIEALKYKLGVTQPQLNNLLTQLRTKQGQGGMAVGKAHPVDTSDLQGWYVA